MDQFVGFAFNPMTAAAAIVSARELEALRLKAEKDHEDLVIQGEILLTISQILIAQDAFAGNSHDDSFKRRFASITAVSEVTPARLKLATELQRDILSLIQRGFSVTCRCGECEENRKVAKEAEESQRLLQVANRVRRAQHEVGIAQENLALYQSELEQFYQEFDALPWRVRQSLLHPKSYYFRGMGLGLALAVANVALPWDPSYSYDALAGESVHYGHTLAPVSPLFPFALLYARVRIVKRRRKRLATPKGQAWSSLMDLAKLPNRRIHENPRLKELHSDLKQKESKAKGHTPN